MSHNLTKLSNGVEGLFVHNLRFNTTLISFNFYLPLNYGKAAEYALLPFMLTSSSKRYPDFSKLNYKLNKLYGAQLSASVEKVGDHQLLKMAISVIDDRFTLDNEELCDQACQLLTELIFEPKVENGAFCEDDLNREKRKAIEHIRSEMSEKRIYAKKRLIEEMYKGKPYGTSKCGTEEQINAITGESLYNAWCDMLKTAAVRVNVISRQLPAGLFDGIAERFSEIERENITDYTVNTPTRKATKVNTVTEHMDIAQGKLVMGFSSRLHGGDDTTMPLLVMCDIFGGGPYSRLFSNVREKMSLCYYCSASSVRVKGLLTVDSGVEMQNIDKAQEEILNQLEIVKKGEFTDFELSSSIKSLTDSFNTYDDSQNALDIWYSLKIGGSVISPNEAALLLNKVDRNAVIKAAQGVNLHTVYRLVPKEGN